MIEKLIVDHLNEGLEGIKAHSLIPAKRKAPFVVVERTGGSIENHIRIGLFVADCYGSSLLEAAELCESVIELMLQLPEEHGGEVSAVRVNSHYNDTDTELHEYKYGALFEVTYY